MNDGLGLRVADRSKHSHSGTVQNCEWEEGKRPFEPPRIADGAAPPALVPYDFNHDALLKTTVFTNGECLAIVYPATVVSSAFGGADASAGAATNAIAQVFSLQTGIMLWENELEYLAGMDLTYNTFFFRYSHNSVH